MSYKQSVFRDDPIAFYPLNGTSVSRTYQSIIDTYATYLDWLDNEPNYGYEPISFELKDISRYNNLAAFSIGNPNFLDILPLVTGSSYDTQYAGCKINSSSIISIGNKSKNYKMFYAGTENLTFGVEFWISFDSNPYLDSQVFTVDYLGDKIVNVYVNNDKIYFILNGKDKISGNALSYTTYNQVKTWDSQCHIFLYYKDGEINISINGSPGSLAQVDKNFIFSYSQNQSAEFYYNLGPSELTSPFVVNDLVFYDHILPNSSIKNHISWGTYDSSPQLYAKNSNASFIDIKESSDMFSFFKDFSDPKKYNEGNLNNLIIDNSGLTLNQIPALTKFGTGTLTTVNGLSVNNTASAVFKNASKHVSINSMSIMGQINWIPNNTGKPSVIFAIDNINKDGWLILAQSEDNKLTLYYYSTLDSYPYTESTQILAQTSSTTSNAVHNFGMYTDNGVAGIYISGATSTSYTTSFPIYENKNFNIYFGNQYSSAITSPLIGTISNISILNKKQKPSKYQNFGSPDEVFISFLNNLNVSQLGTWTYSIPSSQFNEIVGARVYWDSGSSDNTSSSQYVTLEASYDYGDTWSVIKNGSSILQLSDNYSSVYSDTIIRASLYTNNSSLLNLVRLDNLSVGFYKNLTMLSDSGNFILEPRKGTYVSDTFSVRKNFFNILARSDNFGIKLSKTNGNSSIAKIYSSGNSKSYQSIEFWYRLDSLGVDPIQVILDITDQNASLYLDPTTSILYQFGFSNVYINGVALSSGRSITKSEMYHIVCVLNSPLNSSVYLGGDQALNNHSYGTYGFITMYDYAVSQPYSSSRYFSYISSNSSQVALVGSTNMIGSLSEYSASGSGFNSGKPLLTYPSPLFNNL